jgi:hypothetical protein
MLSDMERSRDGYRGRYRDRHNNGSTNRNHNHEDRSTSGNYRGSLSHTNDHNGHYSSRNSPNGGYNYRSSRTSFNSRPVSSRNGSSTHYRHHHNNDDYQPLSSLNRTSSGNSIQSNYYDNHSPSSRFDRSSNHREIYPTLLAEQPILSNGLPPSNSLYYSSSPRDRNLPLPSTQYIEPDRNRYIPLINRRDSSPPVSSYRNERLMEYGNRNSNNDIYMHDEYRTPSPLSLAPLSVRGDPYGDIYRANDYGIRPERYDIPPNRTRDYSNYHNDLYRNSSMPSYIPREQYPSDVPYRSISQSRGYEIPSSSSSSRMNYSSSMDDQESLSRNSRDRNHSSYHDRPNLKRSGSRYNDNEPIPSKRPMRR